MKTITLKPQYTQNKSYYNKAYILIDDTNTIYQLKSYDTIVAEYNTQTQKFTKLWNGYSRTTAKHITDFVKQFTPLTATTNKKWWDNLPCKANTKYKIIAKHPFVNPYRPTTTFDNYDDAQNYCDELNNKNSLSLWFYEVEEI